MAVLREPNELDVVIRDSDLVITTCRDSGPGGQHRNKVESAVQITHKPSGIQIRCCQGKSQHQNRKLAMGLLRAKLAAAQEEKAVNQRNGQRKGQIGTGMRGDKVRTIQCRRDLVVDHRTNKKTSFAAYRKGDFSGLTS